MAAVHLSYEFLVLGSCWPEKCAELTLQLLTLVRAVRAWKPERLEQIVDILVPQTEDEIAEVNQLVPQERMQQHTVTCSCDPCRVCRELHSTRRLLLKLCKVLQVHTSTTRPSLRGAVFGTFTLRQSRCLRHELVWNRPSDPELM